MSNYLELLPSNTDITVVGGMWDIEDINSDITLLGAHHDIIDQQEACRLADLYNIGAIGNGDAFALFMYKGKELDFLYSDGKVTGFVIKHFDCKSYCKLIDPKLMSLYYEAHPDEKPHTVTVKLYPNGELL